MWVLMNICFLIANRMKFFAYLLGSGLPLIIYLGDEVTVQNVELLKSEVFGSAG